VRELGKWNQINLIGKVGIKTYGKFPTLAENYYEKEKSIG